ncbi:PulJ/GspJ family protein [Thermospira aquatica]|uniref:Prepilin-type N-terminal cleavage/methylation domain-containing protein n=1 Tax=Thermospira aquatica TaxID=2828656 RepID=A0AAX3BAV6_9SPIR|nr:prepilin-type N-terminal cleavage/methylation domain-containing protein [Thermospira aquatica]URA09296.1 prepilin-type N-terminal cleavage/methylation domain-containing protein [Thermospira aquatica]
MILSRRWISGFTLIEVLVALSLVSLAVLAVLGVYGTLALTSGKSQNVHRIASVMDAFLTDVQLKCAWTNWETGLFLTNVNGVALEMEVNWEEKGELCSVELRSFYPAGQRTNTYTVRTRFSLAYEMGI